MTKLGEISKDISAVLLGFLLLGAATNNQALAEESENVNFSGVYEGKQAIPNTMAILCQMDGKTMVEEQLTKEEDKDKKEENKPSTLKKCLDKIISKINVEDSAARADAIREFDNVLQEQRLYMMVEGVGKLAVVSQYAKRNDETLNSSGEAKTVVEDTAALANVDANLTDVINTLGTLYATEAKYVALDGLKLVDPAVLAEEKEKEEKKAHNDGKSEVTETVVTAHVTAKEGEDGDQGSGSGGSDDGGVSGGGNEGYVNDTSLDGVGEDGEQESDKFEGEEIIGEYDPTTGRCKTEGSDWGACGIGRYSKPDGKTMWCGEDGCVPYEADGAEQGTQVTRAQEEMERNLGEAQDDLDAASDEFNKCKTEYDAFMNQYWSDGVMHFENMDEATLAAYQSALQNYKDATQKLKDAAQRLGDLSEEAKRLSAGQQ